jgi:NTP pyrophosphatase (non-canonical NTP hydrolase)
MTLDELQAEIRALTEGIEHPRVGAALALAEECGEVMRCVLDREYYEKDIGDALAGEVGDVLIALTEVCDRFGLSLARCAEGAVAKLRVKAPQWREELAGRLTVLRRRMDGPGPASR